MFLHHFTLSETDFYRWRDGADPGRRPRTAASAEPKGTAAKLTPFWGPHSPPAAFPAVFWDTGYLSLVHSTPICPDLFLQPNHQRGTLAAFRIYKDLKSSSFGHKNYNIKPGVLTPV